MANLDIPKLLLVGDEAQRDLPAGQPGRQHHLTAEYSAAQHSAATPQPAVPQDSPAPDCRTCGQESGELVSVWNQRISPEVGGGARHLSGAAVASADQREGVVCPAQAHLKLDNYEMSKNPLETDLALERLTAGAGGRPAGGQQDLHHGAPRPVRVLHQPELRQQRLCRVCLTHISQLHGY